VMRTGGMGSSSVASVGMPESGPGRCSNSCTSSAASFGPCLVTEYEGVHGDFGLSPTGSSTGVRSSESDLTPGASSTSAYGIFSKCEMRYQQNLTGAWGSMINEPCSTDSPS
jgi:hypothetical protein